MALIYCEYIMKQQIKKVCIIINIKKKKKKN